MRGAKAKGISMSRKSEKTRKTAETDVTVSVDLDGTGATSVETGVGFFDHMLTLLGRHGLLDLTIRAAGDTDIDAHHTVEDVGIVLGQAITEALGDKKGIVRTATASVPMDEALAQVSIDLGGRPYLVFRAEIPKEDIGAMPSETIPEFLQALAVNAGMNVHVTVPYGDNAHHVVEAIFKALARALRAAVAIDPRESGIPSTKGTL